MEIIQPFLALFFAVALPPAQAEDASPGKVIAVYVERNTTKLILECKTTLVSGRDIYIGPNYVPTTVGDLLSKSEYLEFHKALAAKTEQTQKGKITTSELPPREFSTIKVPPAENLYYYSASVPGKPKIQNGDVVHLELPPGRSSLLRTLTGKVKEHYVFSQKEEGEVTAVQGDRAMIDRGSLQEVRDRDIYRVYDSSGHYKSMLELRGIGDLQSQGKLYNSFEDFRRGSRGASSVAPGDRIVFVGQRKLFALGLIGGTRMSNERVVHADEHTASGSLLWATTSLDGWSLEILFGGYFRSGNGGETIINPSASFYQNTNIKRAANFIAPIWLKKSIFYPSVVSPFLAAGFTLLQASNHYSRVTSIGNNSEIIDEERGATRPEPVLGTGIELFPGRFFRPRAEIRWFGGPKLTAGGNTYYTESWFWDVGFLTAW